MRKKLFLLLCIVFLLCMCSNVFALSTLHETRETQVINSGTNLTKYTRFTDKGWLNINVLEVDLKDKYTNVEVLTSANGLQTFQNVKAMALTAKNCIAAINADFFTGNYKKGNAIGMTIRDGEVLTSTYYENEVKDTLASFVLNEDDDVIFDYFSNKITLTNLKNKVSIDVAEINKWSSNYAYPVLYTKEWGEMSLGSTEDLVLTELVVKSNKVVEVRYNEKPVEIPENGFVVCALGEAGEILQSSFKKGSKIKLDNSIDLDIDEVKVAVSGGTILVKDGKVAEFTHNITGSNPRTAIGSSKNGNKIYLITVDGRQAASIGLTQAELAEFLVEKEIYFAMNLDGGGSTTMIARELGDTEYTIENLPSDGSLRNVPNAIAVLNTSKTGSLDNLVIEVDSVNVFVGCTKELVVKGYDKYYNPVEIDNSKIKWSYDGVPVSIDGNTLTGGDTAGTSKVTASIGKATGSISIDVLSQPNELTISPKRITLGKGESFTFKVSGQNKNGYYADLKNDEVVWNIESGEGNLKNGVFTASDSEECIISVSAGNAKSFALITIDKSVSKGVNDFENLNFAFKSYPEEVAGNIELDSDNVKYGSYSAKLEYDFTKTNKTRAAYLRFNEGITLDKAATTIDFWFYSSTSSSDQLKAKVTDANGTVQYLMVSKGLESSGWHEMSIDLSNVLLPAKLTDIYIAQDKETELTAGTVYFDDLKINYKTTAENSDTLLPKDIKGVDSLNVSGDLESENAFRIVVSPEIRDGILLEHLKQKRMENVINKNSEIVIFPSQENNEMLVNVEAEKVVASGYSAINYKSATVISLDVSNGGLRATDSTQWLSLKEDITKGKKNIIIVLNDNLENFTDENEKQLFIDVLCELRKNTSKNIWVIQAGENTDYSMKRGVKYLEIASNEVSEPTLESIRNEKYILITVNEDKMTYEIKRVY